MSSSKSSGEQKDTSRETLLFQNKNYTPKYPEIFKFSESFLVPSFLKATKNAKELRPSIEQLKSLEDKDEDKVKKLYQEFATKKREILVSILEMELKNVYSLEIFTTEFCNKLVEEVKNYENTTQVKLRPNSMNKYGIVMDEMGMNHFFDEFVKNYVSHLAVIMNSGAYEIDDHHTFVVEYSLGKDKDLSLHVDDSELTINLCLGLSGFKGGNVFFKGHRDKPTTYNEYGEYENQVGRAILHDGLHMHGAKNLESGERYNLIIWLRSTAYRSQCTSQCSCCDSPCQEESTSHCDQETKCSHHGHQQHHHHH